MTPTEHDRVFMRRIGVLKAESHATVERAHLALPRALRLKRSLDLSAVGRGWGGLNRRKDDPAGFYRRARRLGLYVAVR